MKIAFIGGRTFHHPDGIANFMYNLATELVKLGHVPIVYCESDYNGTEMVNGFKVVHQKSLKSAALTKMILGLKSTIHALFKEKGVEVFHYNTWTPAVLASRIPPLFGRTTILQGHGIEWKRTKYTPKQQKQAKRLESFVAHLNHNWTMCSQEQTEYFKEEYNLDCTTITGAVNLPGEPKESDVLERFGIIPNNYIVYMGRLVQDKNPDFLIKGFMSSKYEKKQLVICGNAAPGSSFEEELHELAKNCSNIIFTGSVFGADKDIILRNSWVYCLPSTLEGLPISLLEGMSYGKVCIASYIPANREALGDGGIWVEKEKAEAITAVLNNLYDHYEDYKWQGEANKTRVATHFSWKKKAEEYVDYLNGVLKK